MKTVVVGERPPELEEFLQRRRARGQDGSDEVWEGVYHVAPMAHAWHGYLENQLAVLLDPFARRAGLVGTGAFNLGEPNDYRVPDHGYHQAVPSGVYVATAAIVVEVVSPEDETWERLGFTSMVVLTAAVGAWAAASSSVITICSRTDRNDYLEFLASFDAEVAPPLT